VTEAVLQDVDVATADPVNPEKIQQALRAQMCAHRAMDAPKHFPAEAVLALSKELRQAAGVHARAPRSTKVALASLSFDIPGMTRHRTFELFVRELQGQFPEGSKFCETSSSFKVGNIKNESLLRDFLQESKVECRADGLVPMRLAICSFHLSKVLRLPRKSEARSYEVLRLSRKIILANLKI